MANTSRRQFLRIAGLGGTAFVIVGVRPMTGLVFAETPTFKGVLNITPAYRALRSGVTGFIDHLGTNASDVLKIDLFDSGSLMKADEQLPAMREGTIQFMFHASSYISRDFAILGIMELPGICEQLYEHGGRLAMESPLWKLTNDELAKSNMFMLSAGGGLMEPEYLWSGQKKTSSLAELQGKRWRVVGAETTEFLKGLGASTVRITSDKTFLALQRGTVDGIVATVDTVVARNLHQQLHYCLRLPVSGLAYAVFFRKDVWNRLTGREKEAFWDAGRWYDSNQARYRTIVQEELWPVVSKAGVRILNPGVGDKELLVKRSQPVWSSWKKKIGGDAGQKAIDLALGRV